MRQQEACQSIRKNVEDYPRSCRFNCDDNNGRSLEIVTALISQKHPAKLIRHERPWVIVVQAREYNRKASNTVAMQTLETMIQNNARNRTAHPVMSESYAPLATAVPPPPAGGGVG